jgi:hypothetical protein
MRGIVALERLLQVNRFRFTLLSQKAEAVESLIQKLPVMMEHSQGKAEEERVMIDQMAALYASASGGEIRELAPDPSPFSRQEIQEAGTLTERDATENLLTGNVEDHALWISCLRLSQDLLLRQAQLSLKNCLGIMLQWSFCGQEDLEVKAAVQ